MQVNCPRCSQRLVVDDAKIPKGPFMLKCPKCQNGLKLPGKNAADSEVEQLSPTAPQPKRPAADDSEATSTAPEPTPTATPSARPPTPSPGPAAPPPASSPPPLPPRASPPSPDVANAFAPAEGGERALVSLEDAANRDGMASTFQRLGYEVQVASPEEAIQRLQREAFSVVVTSCNGADSDDGSERALYRRVVALAPELRRTLFLVLIGDDFTSGHGTQAFGAQADLVLHPKDVNQSDELVRGTVFEKRRIYKGFLDCLDRWHERRYSA